MAADGAPPARPPELLASISKYRLKRSHIGGRAVGSMDIALAGASLTAGLDSLDITKLCSIKWVRVLLKACACEVLPLPNDPIRRYPTNLVDNVNRSER